MKNRVAQVFVLLSCVGFLLSVGVGCQPPSAEQKRSIARKDVLAKVGNRLITVQDFQLAVKGLSSMMRRSMSRFSNKRNFLLKLVMYELLLQEAKRKGNLQRPIVQQVRDRAAIELLVKKIASQVNTLRMPQAELEKQYKARLKEFMIPEKRSIQHILFEVPFRAKKEVWAKRKEAVDAVLPLVRKANEEKGGFEKMVSKYSQDLNTRRKGGSLGTTEKKGSRWGEEITKAAFALQKVGDLVLVRTSRGFHIVRLSRLLPSKPKTLSQVSGILQADWLKKKQDEHFRKYLKKLNTSTKMTINQKQWAALKASLKP